MNCSSFYTQLQDDVSVSRNGGIILKGNTRNTRQPVHMMLLVDTSGSMEMEHKLDSVKKSVQLMLELLSPEDRLSLVTFSDDSKTILHQAIPTPQERQAIQYRVNNLEPDGSTNMSAGLLEARGLVEPPSSGRKQGLILLTDGHANIGVHSEEGLIEILKRIQTESPGLSLTTVAYGVDHNAEMLTNLAKAGGGAYNVVTNLEDVATVFGDILGGLISVSAQKVEIQFPPGAEVNTSYRTETNIDGMITVYVGDVYADAEITVLFKSSPSKGPIRIKGTDMTTLNIMDVIMEPQLLQRLEDIPVQLIMAEYRQKTTTLLHSLRKGNDPSIKTSIESFIKQIQDDDRVQTHPLKPMLLEDLEKALTLTARSGHLTQQETVEMFQHSAYIGTSKGLRSQTNPTPASRHRHRGIGLTRQTGLVDEDMAMGAPPTNHLTSPFSNQLQAQLASVMRTMSSQPPQPSEEENA